MLDVGCGSGILALVALALGAARARAVDVDPTSIEVTRENAARNGLERARRGDTTALAAVDERSSRRSLANIEARVLIPMAPRARARASRRAAARALAASSAPRARRRACAPTRGFELAGVHAPRASGSRWSSRAGASRARGRWPVGLVRAPIDGARGGRAAPRRRDASHYLARVLRLRAGDAFVAFDPARAIEADAEVAGRGRAPSRGDDRRRRARPGAVAPARRSRWSRGSPRATSATRSCATRRSSARRALVIARTARSVVKLDAGAPRARSRRWASIAQEAARQCGRGDAPAIDGPLALADALARVPRGRRAVLPLRRRDRAARPAARRRARGDAPLAFAVGPEGGLTPSEVAAAARARVARSCRSGRSCSAPRRSPPRCSAPCASHRVDPGLPPAPDERARQRPGATPPYASAKGVS